jgi:hypothetical protein
VTDHPALGFCCWGSCLASSSHRVAGPMRISRMLAADVDHAADQEDAQHDRERKQHEAAKRLCEQRDPDFELRDRHGDKRSHHEHRNGNADGKPDVELDELPEVAQGRQSVFQLVEDEPAHLSGSFDCGEMWQFGVHYRHRQRFRPPMLSERLLHPFCP